MSVRSTPRSCGSGLTLTRVAAFVGVSASTAEVILSRPDRPVSGYNYCLCRVMPSFTVNDQLSDATTLPLGSASEILERLRTKYPKISSDGVHGGWLDPEHLVGSFSIHERALSFSRIEPEELRVVSDLLGMVVFDPQKGKILFGSDGWSNKTIEPTR